MATPTVKLTRGKGTTLNRRRLAMLLPLLVGNLLVLLLCVEGLGLLSAARAYVSGESLWSKSRAEALRELRAYSVDGNTAQLRAFQARLDVPLADREARALMNAETPDMPAITAAFVRGGVMPDDVPQMVRLYRWFGSTALLQPAIIAWQHGDELIARSQALGLRMQVLVNASSGADGAKAQAGMVELRAELDELDMHLLSLEEVFSEALGDASRAAYVSLSVVLTACTLTLTLVALALLWRGMRRESDDAHALGDANRRWQLAAESDGLGIFEWSPDSDMVRLDPRACAAYGLECGPAGLILPRQVLRDRVADEDAPRLQALMDQVLAFGGPFAHRYRVRTPETAEALPVRYLDVTGVIDPGLDGESPRVVGITRDASLRVEQEHLASDKLAAERVASARMQFLSRLSHELRTPLNAVLGLSELLQIERDDALSPRQQQRVEMINAAGMHLLHLVDDVLDISRIDAGRFKLECESTELAKVINTALTLNAPQEAQFGAKLEVRAPDGVNVWADAHRLGQVLTNLLSNACKYNRPGGRVLLDVQTQGEWVEIAVSDEGPGMSEADIGSLFQPFQRLAATAQKPGTGLGLTIVKLLVEQMGGRISVQSRVGRGSVFTVNLKATPV